MKHSPCHKCYNLVSAAGQPSQDLAQSLQQNYGMPIPQLHYPSALSQWLLGALLLAVAVYVVQQPHLHHQPPVLSGRKRDTRLRAVLIVLLWVAAFGLALVPNVSLYAGQIAVPGKPLTLTTGTVTPFALTPIALAAGLVGPHAALVAGLLSGLGRLVGGSAEPIALAIWALAGAVAANMLRQPYAGRLGQLLRHPVIGIIVTGLTVLLARFLNAMFIRGIPDLYSLFFATQVNVAASLAMLVEVGLASVIAVVVQRMAQGRWFVPARRQSFPWNGSLRKRLLWGVLPLIVTGYVGLIAASYGNTLWMAPSRMARQLHPQLEGMKSNVPAFMAEGGRQLSLAALTVSEVVGEQLTAENTTRTTNILTAIKTQSALFDGLWYEDRPVPQMMASSGLPFEALNAPVVRMLMEDSTLTGQPQWAVIVSGVTREVYWAVPVPSATSEEWQGVLVARATVDQSLLVTILAQMQVLGGGSTTVYLTDNTGQVLAGTGSATLPDVWRPGQRVRGLTLNSRHPGSAFVQSVPNGQQQLVLIVPVQNAEAWQLVTVVPFDVVLNNPASNGLPMVLAALLPILVVAVTAVIVAKTTTRLNHLILSSRKLAEVDFTQGVQLHGDDEIAELSSALENMRHSLRERLEELALLRTVAQNATDSLNLPRTLPPILHAAGQVTGAMSVRLLGNQGITVASGLLGNEMAALDDEIRALLSHPQWQRRIKEEGLLRIENVQRARTVLNMNHAPSAIHALLVVPLVFDRQTQGVLWLGFDAPRHFSSAELGFVQILAGQAAGVLANSALYQASERRRMQLQATLNATPDAIVLLDEHGAILLSNASARGVLGLSDSAPAEQPLTRQLTHPALRTLLSGQPGETRQAEVKLDNGHVYAAALAPVRAEATRSAPGVLMGQVLVLRDVTSYKELDQLKSDFVAMVSHDLRRPLSTLAGYAKMLSIFGPLTPKQEEFAGRIVGGVDELNRLVEDLLSLNRLEQADALSRQLTPVAHLVDKAVQQVLTRAHQKQIQISVVLPDHLPDIEVDSTALRVALVNLLDNGIAYTENGGQVTISAAQLEDELVLMVSDSGIGIAPSDQLRLFEKFFRVARPGDSQQRGSGLGLAIVKSTAERHGGRVWVESQLGQGSTFYLALPLPHPSPVLVGA